MRAGTVLIALVAVSWVAVTEATVVVTGTAATVLALKGLAVLKGAAIAGHVLGSRRRHHHHHKRSIESQEQDEDNILLSTVGQLDSNGCILKLLCHLQVKDEASRTTEENILIEKFTNGIDVRTIYNEAFVSAIGIGRKTHDAVTCNKNFPKCPLDEGQLGGLLRQAWGCGFDIFGDETTTAA